MNEKIVLEEKERNSRQQMREAFVVIEGAGQRQRGYTGVWKGLALILLGLVSPLVLDWDFTFSLLLIPAGGMALGESVFSPGEG